MPDVSLDFLARQLDRIGAVEDQITVLTGIAIRLDGAVQGLAVEMRGLVSEHIAEMTLFRQALDFSPNPAASITRCVLFWKLASWPSTSKGAASAIAWRAASTHPPSDLAKSLST